MTAYLVLPLLWQTAGSGGRQAVNLAESLPGTAVIRIAAVPPSPPLNQTLMTKRACSPCRTLVQPGRDRTVRHKCAEADGVVDAVPGLGLVGAGSGVGLVGVGAVVLGAGAGVVVLGAGAGVVESVAGVGTVVLGVGVGVVEVGAGDVDVGLAVGVAVGVDADLLADVTVG